MKKDIGRNSLCPCGSGKKYKKCCLNKDTTQKRDKFTTTYRFEVGSYGDTGNFMPSITCLRSIKPNKWDYYFVLVKPNKTYHGQDQAETDAEVDMTEAYKIKDSGGSDAALAAELKNRGYVTVDDFNIVKDTMLHA